MPVGITRLVGVEGTMGEASVVAVDLLGETILVARAVGGRGVFLVLHGEKMRGQN